MERVKIVLTVFVAALAIAGCVSTPPLPIAEGEPGTLTLFAQVPKALEDTVDHLELVLSQDNLVREFNVPIKDSRATFEVSDLYTGVWELTLQMRDDAGDITHEASDEILIFEDRSTVAELVLKPKSGELQIDIDLSALAESDLLLVQSARVSVHPGGYSSGRREDDGLSISITRSMEPRTYDYRVTLYGSETNSSGAVYNSPWDQVTILPGKVTTVSWTVQSGDLSVIGKIDPVPGRPTDLLVNHLGEGLLELSWTPGPDHEAADGYLLYYRTGPFDSFSVLEELPADVSTWQVSVAPKATTTYEYALSAFTRSGYESARSPVSSVTVHVANK